MIGFTDFEDDVAIVTGGTRGIGRAVAEQLAQGGARTIVTYSADEESASETRKQLSEYSVESMVERCDVRDFNAVGALFDEVTTKFQSPTVVVNNAGIRRDSILTRMNPEEWQSVLETNLTGAFNCTRHATRHMLRGDGGRIVNVSSVAGQRGWPGQANYAASKAGLNGFTRAVAGEFSEKDIRINAVAPGYTDTDMLDEVNKANKESIPPEQTATPEEIAAAIIFLASPASSFVNGEVLRVDDGLIA